MNVDACVHVREQKVNNAIERLRKSGQSSALYDDDCVSVCESNRYALANSCKSIFDQSGDWCDHVEHCWRERERLFTKLKMEEVTLFEESKREEKVKAKEETFLKLDIGLEKCRSGDFNLTIDYSCQHCIDVGWRRNRRWRWWVSVKEPWEEITCLKVCAARAQKRSTRKSATKSQCRRWLIG